ncbi:MAG: hypothetical protein ACT4P9_12270 [Betaproteobacteria bacterium]
MKRNRAEGERTMDPDRTVTLTWKDISEAELRALLAGVTSGSDPTASMRLVEYFHSRIHDNLPYDQTILFAYLDHVFGRLLDGQPADRAFGFERRPGKD